MESLHKINDIIFADMEGHSKKPIQLYDIFEKLCSNGCYLELFGRVNNTRDGWVTIGDQVG